MDAKTFFQTETFNPVKIPCNVETEMCAICEKYFPTEEMSYDDDVGMFCCENVNCDRKFWKD